jgi:acyl carrier protein
MIKLTQLLSEILEIEPEQVHDNLTPDDVPTWDSFNGLMIVSRLESEYSVKFTMDEVTSVKCVADIKAYLRNHGVDEEYTE